MQEKKQEQFKRNRTIARNKSNAIKKTRALQKTKTGAMQKQDNCNKNTGALHKHNKSIAGPARKTMQLLHRTKPPSLHNIHFFENIFYWDCSQAKLRHN